MKLKEEIKKAIGSTDDAKKRLQHKMERPSRFTKLPLYMSLAATAIAIFALWLNFAPSNTQEHAITLPMPNDTPSEVTVDNSIPFTVIHDQDGNSLNINQQYVALLATDQQQLDHYLKYFDLELPGLSFETHDVLITQFSSDGCGLVIDTLTTNENTLTIQLNLPKDLRNKKEIACTSILMPNVQIVQIPKSAQLNNIEQVHFSHFADATVALNELSINDSYYNFSLIEDPLEIEKIYINAIPASTQKIVTDEEEIALITNSIHRSEKLAGILNMTNFNYQLIVQRLDGEQLTMQLVVNEQENSVTIVSEKNTHQAFELKGEDAEQLISILK